MSSWIRAKATHAFFSVRAGARNFLFYFLNFSLLQLVLYLFTIVYFFFKLSAGSKGTPSLSEQSPGFFPFLVFFLLTYSFLSLSAIPGLNEHLFTSLSLQRAMAATTSFYLLFFFFFLFISLFKYSSFLSQLSSLFLFLFMLLLTVFFVCIFSFTNHFELLCVFEYLNALIVLYILVSVPTLKPSVHLFRAPLSHNVRFLSSYFFIPAILNYFFLLFIVSICLFFFYLYFLSDLLFQMSFSGLGLVPVKTGFSLFLFLFLLLKLGVAPFHFWKLEIFESFNLTHFSFFSTVYFFISLLTFQVILLQIPLFGSKSVFYLLCSVILYNLVFCTASINSVLNLRQFLVLSALLNLNLVLLSTVLSQEGSQPFFFLFTVSYVFLAFIFYFFFNVTASNAKFFSTLDLPQNGITKYLLFTLPLISLAGVAPSLGFFIKLSFLLANLHNETLLIIFFYILTIVVSVVFYFQLFKTNSTKALIQPEKNSTFIFQGGWFFLLVLVTTVLLTLTPVFSGCLFFFADGFQLYLTLLFSQV